MSNFDINNFHERELHPFLNYYLHYSLGVHAKTIYQERSINALKGENEWVHPDMVGYSITTSNWHEKVVSLAEQYNIPKVILYSFELKKEITMSNLREVFFQAVSNSSWANEGYLVAASIDTEDEKLMQKMSRLSNSFGIGIINLNLQNPVSSSILFSAQRRDMIDGDTVNHLFEINSDFKEFLMDVENGVKINRVVSYNLDEVKTMAELQDVMESSEEKSNSQAMANDMNSRFDHVVEMDWASDVTGKKPKRITIDDEEYEADSWKMIYIKFCEYLCRIDLEKFKQTKLTGKKRPYLSQIDKDLRVAYYLEEAEVFLEVNLSAQSIIRNIQFLMGEFHIEKHRVKIILEK